MGGECDIPAAYAIVPARHGSRRIPEKNIRPLMGTPIVLRVLRTLTATKLFDEVIVSTESDAIRSLVTGAGFDAPFLRPQELAGDTVSTRAVVEHAIDYLRGRGAPRDSHFCTVYPTAVLVRKEDIESAQTLLNPGVCDFVFSAVRSPGEIERAWRRGPDGLAEPVDPHAQLTQSQDFGPAYFDAGQFYWATHNGWTEHYSERGRNSRLFELSALDAVDVNTESDWEMLEELFVKRSSNASGHE